MKEIIGITGDKGQPMTACRGRDQTIHSRQSMSGFLRNGLQGGPHAHFILPQREEALVKGRQ